MPTPEEAEFLKAVKARHLELHPDSAPDQTKQVLLKALSDRRSRQPQQQPSIIEQQPETPRDRITAQQGLEALPRKSAQQTIGEIQQRGFGPEASQRLMQQLAGPARAISNVQGAAGMLLEQQEPGTIEKSLSAATQYAAPKALSALETATNWLSTPGNAVRGLLEPNPTVPYTWENVHTGKRGGAPGFVKQIEEKAQTSTPWAIGNAVLEGGAIANPVLNPLGPAAKVAGLFSEPARQVSEYLNEQSKTNTVAGATDLLMLFNFGIAGQGKTIGPQVARVLELSGADAATIERAVPMAQEIIQTKTGPRAAEYLSRLMAETGAKPQIVEQVFGPGFTYAGKQGASFAGFEAADVANKLGLTKAGLPEQMTRRALDKLPDLSTLKGTSFDKTFKKAEVLKTKHSTINETAKVFDDYKQNVAPFMPADKARRELLVKWMDAPEPFLPDGAPNPEYQALRDQMFPPQKSSFDLPQRFLETGAENPAYAPAKQAIDEGIGAAAAQAEKDNLAIQKLREFFNRTGQKYKEAGLIDELTANASGDYVPRLWREEQKGLVAYLKRHLISDEHPQVSSRVERAADVAQQAPLGKARPGYKAPLDPHEIVSEYVPPMERAAAEKRLEDAMKAAYGGKVPSDVQKAVRNTFSGKNIKIWDGLINMFKRQQLFGVGRFLKANLFEEPAKAISANLYSGANDFETAEQIAKAVTSNAENVAGTPYTFGQLRKEAADAGLFQSSSFADINEPSKAVRAFNEASDVGAGIGKASRVLRRAKESPGATAVQAFEDVSNVGLNRLGRRAAEKLDSHLKLAGFVGRLRQGDSIPEALANVRRVHFDMMDQGPVLKSVKKVVPFAAYTANTTKNLPGVIARNPWVASTQAREFQDANRDRVDEPPVFQAESGQTRPLGDDERLFVQSLMAAAGAPVDPAFGMSYKPRGSLLEGLAQPLEAARGNFEPLGIMAGPLVQPVLEGQFKKDFVTKRDQGPLEINGSFPLVPIGTPGFPAELQAGREHAAVAKYLAPWLGPYLTQAGNIAAERAGAPQGPFASAPFSDDARQKAALQFLAMLGFPVALTSPVTEITNATRTEQAEDAAKLQKQIRGSIRKRASSKR